MVRTVMTELHLERPSARREPEQLVAETYAERRQATVDQRPDRVDRVGARLRIAGTVRQEGAIGRERAHVRRGRLRRDHGDPAAAFGQEPQDVVLHAEIVGDDMEPGHGGRAITVAQLPRAAAPRIRLGARHDAREIKPRHRRRGLRARDRVGDLGLADRRRRVEAAVLRATLAEDPRESPGVEIGDANDPVGHEIRREVPLRAEVGHGARQIADHEARREQAPRFDVVGIHADVADVRIRERDDLARIRRVGQDLLVARHRGVEYDLADRVPRSADRGAAEYRAVGEREYRHRAMAAGRQQPCA